MLPVVLIIVVRPFQSRQDPHERDPDAVERWEERLGGQGPDSQETVDDGTDMELYDTQVSDRLDSNTKRPDSYQICFVDTALLLFPDPSQSAFSDL